MLQRPTMLRSPTREHRQRETRGFVLGFVRRCYPIDTHYYSGRFCPSTIRVEMVAHLMHLIENTGQTFLDKSDGSLVGVSEVRAC
jgi:hypothetical protein